MAEDRAPSTRALRGGVALACALYFASGAAGLLVEQVFERLLTTVIGTSVEAAAIVLTVYFAGVSLGALAFPLARRVFASPLAIYAVAEAVAGALSVALGAAFGPIQRASVALLHAVGTEGATLTAARVVVAACFIGPPALAVGVTFPAVSAFAEGRPETRRLMTVFYALNVGGGVLAAIVAPYLLFPRLGLTTTVALAGAVQLGVAAAATGLGEAPSAPQPDHRPRDTGRPRDRRLLLALSLASGALVFGWEVLWVHLIGVTLGMSVYAFSMMLALVLLGLFLGGTIGAALPSRAHGDAAIALAFLASAAACSLVFPGWSQVGERLLEGGSFVRSFADAEVLRYNQAAVLLGAPAMCLGLVYPALLRSPRFPVGDAARFAARLGVANAVGSGIGAMGVAHVLIPRIGCEFTYLTLIGASMVLGLTLAMAAWRRGTARAALALGALAATLAAMRLDARWDRLALTSGAHVYLHGMFVRKGTRLDFWHEDAVGGVTTVVANKGPDGEVKFLLTNGKFQGADRGEIAAQTSFALLPITATTGRSRALAIGLGTGHTSSALAAIGFRDVDIVELAPGMVAAARAEFATLNHGVLDDPRARLVLEDGRNFLLRSAQRYDLVSIEISSIWFAGATNLYSRQFYELARTRLATGGVLSQWVQVHHTSRDDFLCVVRTVAAAFPHVAVWYLGGQGIVLASEAPLAFRPDAMPAVLAARDLDEGVKALERDGVDPARLFERQLFDEATTRRLVAAAERLGVPINTDENRHLEYSSPRHNISAPSTDELFASLRALAAEPATK